MATYKTPADLSYHDDTKLWKEIVSKEVYAKKINKVERAGFGFTNQRPKTGSGYSKSVFSSKNNHRSRTNNAFSNHYVKD